MKITTTTKKTHFHDDYFYIAEVGKEKGKCSEENDA